MPDVLPDIGPDELRSRVLQRSGVLRRRRRFMRAAPIALVVMVAAVVLAEGDPSRRVRTVPPADNAPLHEVDPSSRGSGHDEGGGGRSVPAGPTVPGPAGGGGAPPAGGVPVPGLPGGGFAPSSAVDNGSPFPYTNDLVVFEGPSNSAGGVYIMNSDGSGRRQIPLPQQTAQWPALSPNRTMIAYAAIAAVGTETRGVFVAGLDGSNARLVVTGPRHYVQQLRWMPDGSSLLFATWGQTGGTSGSVTGTGETDIYRVTLDGRLTLLGRGSAPEPSPDAALIAYRPPGGANGSWVMNADGSGARQLAASDWTAFQYAWSPDGRTLAYTESEDGGEAPPRLTLLDLPTGRRRVVLDEASSPAWSPDGKAFAFTRFVEAETCTPVMGCSRTTVSRIWTARPDGSGARQLSPDSGDDSGPQFPAHDGRRAP